MRLEQHGTTGNSGDGSHRGGHDVLRDSVLRGSAVLRGLHRLNGGELVVALADAGKETLLERLWLAQNLVEVRTYWMSDFEAVTVG